ncbi:serine hydrolase domain-containing protein [Natrialba aegyptia]|uniref:Beta-lactamase-related domain-containing protein n=1 Tax=Natrialba aegyptia DSM 13077 TaxID=1227491 RepID=M0BAR4_9EURY|nr:serine hydrolase domain-containing protein [Natrialba aegyptia]ELZ06754.1 hypothetical protein C480_06967 [Natrialba aegyptia DSM 13077]
MKSLAASVPAVAGLGSVAGSVRANSSIESDIDDIKHRYGIQGVSAAVLENSSFNHKWEYASGYYTIPSVGNRVLTTDHRLRIASVTKVLTASAVLRLIDQGRLGMYDQVFGSNGILSGYRWEDPDFDCSLRVDDLLSHKIRTKNVSRPVYKYPDQENADADDAINEVLQADEITRVTEDDWCVTDGDYTNWSYGVLGAIVEEVEAGMFSYGNTFRDFVRDELLANVSNVDKDGMGTVADKEFGVVEDEAGHHDYRDNESVYDSKAMREPAWAWGSWAARPIEIARITRAVYEDDLWDTTYDESDAYMLYDDWLYHGGAQAGTLAYAYCNDDFALCILINTRRSPDDHSEWDEFDSPRTELKTMLRDNWSELV